MEESDRKVQVENGDKEILYSKTIHAGKRIYYLDVKRNLRDDLFLAITESKKVLSKTGGQTSFEKHKIFLYQEDFDKFLEGMNQAIGYINDNQEPHHYNNETSVVEEPKADTPSEKNDDTDSELGGEIKLNIDF